MVLLLPFMAIRVVFHLLMTLFSLLFVAMLIVSVCQLVTVDEKIYNRYLRDAVPNVMEVVGQSSQLRVSAGIKSNRLIGHYFGDLTLERVQDVAAVLGGHAWRELRQIFQNFSLSVRKARVGISSTAVRRISAVSKDWRKRPLRRYRAAVVNRGSSPAIFP
jgi:hypothetical protein